MSAPVKRHPNQECHRPQSPVILYIIIRAKAQEAAKMPAIRSEKLMIKTLSKFLDLESIGIKQSCDSAHDKVFGEIRSGEINLEEFAPCVTRYL